MEERVKTFFFLQAFKNMISFINRYGFEFDMCSPLAVLISDIMSKISHKESTLVYRNEKP